MKFIVSILVLLTIMTLSYVNVSWAQQGDFLVTFDKGSVEIQVGPVNSDLGYELTWETSEGCMAEVNVRANDSGVTVSHSEDVCQNGASFILKLPVDSTTRVHINNGILTLANVSGVLNALSKLKAIVDVGSITVSDKRIKPIRINNYMGQKANYVNGVTGSSQFPELHLKSLVGLIKL